MEVQNIISEKQKHLKIIDKYKFCFHKCLANNIQRWKCTVKTCTAYLKINENDDILLNVSDTDHSHDALSEAVINRQIVSNSLKRKGTQELYERPAKLMHRHLKESIDFSVKSTLTITDIRYIKNNLYRARSEQLPKLPTNILTVHSALNAIDCITNENEPFLFLNDSINGIVMFTCKSNLEFLSKIKTVYVDGTFEYCTKFFCQLFTVHGLFNNYYVPLVYFLLKDKQTISYSKAFKAIDLECSKLCQDFKIDVIYVDFEVSIHKAIQKIWPETLIKGCRFHLGQSWWRKMQETTPKQHFIC
ncbi:unnamed protein product [Macrosiphum euphorbiae]|uniref:MULE transposase domain-containing protein n=1 Tax=Macrosiphum euphorbiae TaxID=13131 RepID=A0AAV0VVN5_9HEMI|nr:unnamed protein product [Macrosiphum euphorbiae]